MSSNTEKDECLQAIEAFAASPEELKFDDIITKDEIKIGDYRLVCTCPACPEQYDVFDGDFKHQVGYLRMRHGLFRADSPDVFGATVYEASPEGDGVFEEHERRRYLAEAVAAIHKYQHRTKDDTSDGVRIAD